MALVTQTYSSSKKNIKAGFIGSVLSLKMQCWKRARRSLPHHFRLFAIIRQTRVSPCICAEVFSCTHARTDPFRDRPLSRHGYLRDEFGVVGGQWRGLGLTERGLTALNSVPDALSGKEPLGKRLVVAVGKGSIDTIKQLIPAIIQQAFLG